MKAWREGWLGNAWGGGGKRGKRFMKFQGGMEGGTEGSGGECGKRKEGCPTPPDMMWLLGLTFNLFSFYVVSKGKWESRGREGSNFVFF